MEPPFNEKGLKSYRPIFTRHISHGHLPESPLFGLSFLTGIFTCSDPSPHRKARGGGEVDEIVDETLPHLRKLHRKALSDPHSAKERVDVKRVASVLKETSHYVCFRLFHRSLRSLAHVLTVSYNIVRFFSVAVLSISSCRGINIGNKKVYF